MSETKICQNCKKEFVITDELKRWYEKFDVPLPTFCVSCKLQRKMMFRNERTFYKRKCSKCNKDVVSIYSADKPYIVYCDDCWVSDWDALTYGKEYDFSRPFFAQYQELYLKIPKQYLWQENNVNCQWVNRVVKSKNCYLDTSGLGNEDTAYNTIILSSRDCYDNYHIRQGELCYGNFMCNTVYKVFNSKLCSNCSETYFSFNCSGCSNVIGCVNLKNKKFHIFNEPVSETEFKTAVSLLGSYSQAQKTCEEYLKLMAKSIHKHANIKNCVNSTGDFLENCNNCLNAYCSVDVENSMNAVRATVGIKDCLDVFGGTRFQKCYEYMDYGEDSYNLICSMQCGQSYNIYYTNNVRNCHDMFGCVGLIRNKAHCILNKQYTKEEYEQMLPRIIDHMNKMFYYGKNGRKYGFGEFFPVELATFDYNESVAMEVFPMTEQEVADKQYVWKQEEKKDRMSPTLLSINLTDNIKDVSDDIVNQIIECAHKGSCNEICTKVFRIISKELAFYRANNVPLPRLCPNCRHKQRLLNFNNFQLTKRLCQCAGRKSDNNLYSNTSSHHHCDKHCPNEFETTYAPDRPEIVYCEQCYQSEVV